MYNFRHAAFIAGSILASFIIMTIIDEDVLNVEHVIGTMTALGIIITVCHSCIPTEVSECWKYLLFHWSMWLLNCNLKENEQFMLYTYNSNLCFINISM